jgi:hypothetical protein
MPKRSLNQTEVRQTIFDDEYTHSTPLCEMLLPMRGTPFHDYSVHRLT